MKEILGENLLLFFANSGLNGKCTYSGNTYEVWEVSDKDYNVMCNMSEEEFVKLCPDGMWRSAEGSVLGCPCIEYKINGNKISAWDGDYRQTFYDTECKVCEDKIDGLCQGSELDINDCYKERKYSTLLEYLCNELGCSQPRNVCALAVDLARYNHMTLGELFNKYQGEE